MSTDKINKLIYLYEKIMFIISIKMYVLYSYNIFDISENG